MASFKSNIVSCVALSGYFGKKSSIISNKLKDFLEKYKGFSNKRPKKPGTIANIDCGFVKNYNFFENWKDPAPP